jgi:hypothetical protein
MSKTAFSKKAEILGQFWILYRDDDAKSDDWSDFFAYADVGLPLAYMEWQKLVTVKKDGRDYIEETWSVYCNMLGIDPEKNWEDIGKTFDAFNKNE